MLNASSDHAARMGDALEVEEGPGEGQARRHRVDNRVEETVQLSKAKQADILFLVATFSRRKWRTSDVVEALKWSGVLDDVLADKAADEAELQWLKSIIKNFTWSIVPRRTPSA